MKKLFIVLLLILVIVSIIGCSSNPEEPVVDASESEVEDPVDSEETNESAMDDKNDSEESSMELTLSELAEYDGKDGQPAYVAVEGVVYDVSEIDAWVNGEHNGAVAGQDITEALMNQSPHGPSKLSLAKRVGVIVEDSSNENDKEDDNIDKESKEDDEMDNQSDEETEEISTETEESDDSSEEMEEVDKEESDESSEEESQTSDSESTSEANETKELEDEEVKFTLTELAMYDGKDGQRAYVAVEGIVYDVTDVYAWIEGEHNGVVAGQDITEALMNQSPHGPSKLSLATKVGILVEE